MKRIISSATRLQMTTAASVALIASLLLVISSANTAPLHKATSGGAGSQVRLELTLKLNNSAETTTDRSVNLNFSLVEHINGAGGSFSGKITEYRVREVGLNEPLTNISASPWQPFPSALPGQWSPLTLELGERNDAGVRYGERRVLLQVNTINGTSDVASDTITLEPVLKEYTVHAAADHTHPLIQYAASQGFKFDRTFFEPCTGGTGGSGSPDMSGGFALITGAALSCPPPEKNIIGEPSPIAPDKPKCETKFEYELFGGRQLNQFWHIKSVSVSGGDVKFHGVNSYLLKGHVTVLPACCPPGTYNNGQGSCNPNNDTPTVTIGDIVIEGPTEDDFVDTANPWKNAFVKFQLHPINPNILKPH